MDNIDTVVLALHMLGEAHRSDWSMVDGLTARRELNYISELVQTGAVKPEDALMDALGIQKNEYGYTWAD